MAEAEGSESAKVHYDVCSPSRVESTHHIQFTSRVDSLRKVHYSISPLFLTRSLPSARYLSFPHIRTTLNINGTRTDSRYSGGFFFVAKSREVSEVSMVFYLCLRSPGPQWKAPTGFKERGERFPLNAFTFRQGLSDLVLRSLVSKMEFQSDQK